jgi:pentose-5-phosphate-3-epimerase
VRIIRSRLRPQQRLQMDGGIGPNQAEAVRSAGCDVLVAASAIFKQPRESRASVVQQLRG